MDPVEEQPQKRGPGRPPKEKHSESEIARAITILSESQTQIAAHLGASAKAAEISAEATRLALKPPYNKVAAGISVFCLRGKREHPLPDLKCDIHAPHTMSPGSHGCDREEVELWNLLEPGEFTVTLGDGSETKLMVEGEQDSLGRLQMLRVMSPSWSKTSGNAHLMWPGARTWLRQVIGEAAEGVMTMVEEARLIAAGKLSVSKGA